MATRRTTLPALLTVALSLALSVTSCSVFGGSSDSGDPSPTPTPTAAAGETADATVAAFLQAWQKNWTGDKNTEALTEMTGDAAFATRLADVGETMVVTKVALTPQGAPDCGFESRCTTNVKVDATLKGVGDASWVSPVVVKKAASPDANPHWTLVPNPSTIHPDLTDTNRLRRVREQPTRAPIVDRNGRKLAWAQPIVRVGLEAGKADAAAATKLAGIVDVDAAAFAKKLAATAKGQFVEAIVLRKAEYTGLASKVGSVKGVTVIEDTRALAVTPEFARGVLGSVAPATKETLANAGDTASATDEVGSFGLQYAFQKQLAGTPATSVRIVDPAADEVVTTIATTGDSGQAGSGTGKPLKTTLDYAIQTAAEKAVSQAQSKAHKVSIVVVQPSTGQILAVANGPGARNDNPAMTGTYAPGSTFKIVSSAALIGTGLNADSKVPCTASINVDGRRFVNYDAIPTTGTMTLQRSFELSCNTAFISQREKVAGSVLPDTAAMFGLGAKWDLPIGAFSGSIPSPSSATDLAASMIGQARITASPLAMAGVAAAVASGTAHAPTLIEGAEPTTPSATPIPAATAEALRSMMRSTVANGTARVLAGEGQVGAKTGTAEVGSASKLSTNAWMVGFRGDLAFAVVVEGGASGGHDAGPLAKTLLANVPQ